MKKTVTVNLKDVAADDNRKYTKDDGFEQLVNSVRQHGVLENPALRELPDGGFKIIAGRRRMAAARNLKISEVECTVYSADDPASDEEIALAENVNRLDMHPLDEAVLFSSMAAKGASVEEIAKRYARSPSAIYKRLRLAPLVEELKGMFRDGMLDITGAAVLAELPEEEQKEFYKLHGQDADPDEGVELIRIYEISDYVRRKQKNTITESMKKTCASCKKRTHNDDNALFAEEDDAELFNDVCLDGECYRAKWNAMIGAALKAQMVQMSEAGLITDDKIFFRGGVPERIYKGASKVRINVNKKDVDFEVLREKNYDRAGETARKKDACWLIHTDCTGEIDVRRVGYKAKGKQEEKGADAGKGNGKNINYKVEQYGREALEAVGMELQIPTASEVARVMEEKKVEPWKFKQEVEKIVFERVVAWRIEKDLKLHKEKKPSRGYLELFMKSMYEEGCGEREFEEKLFDGFQKRWLNELFNGKNIKEISVSLGIYAQDVFHFLLLSMLSDSYIPDLDDLKKIGKEKHLENHSWYLFWRYADMNAEEYTAVYLQAAKEVAAAALKPKYLPGHNPGSAKGWKKKAELKKKTAPEVSKELKEKFEVDEPNDDDDNYPFGPAAGEDDTSDDE